MKQNEQFLIKELLSNLRVEILQAGYLRCPKSWREIDYVPDYNKLYLIKDGEGRLVIDNKEYYPKPGQMFLMPQGIKQSYSYTNLENTYLKYWVHFTASIGDVNLFDLIQIPYFIDVSDLVKALEIFGRLEKSYNSSNSITSNLVAKACLYELISLFLEHISAEKILFKGNGEIARLNSVLQYIENHLSEKITIKQLAGEVYLHPNYFIRLFKNNMGVSPVNYINRKRLEKAKQLLSIENISVNEVAVQSGFQNVSYFFSIFKKHIGMAPNEYRFSLYSQDKV